MPESSDVSILLIHDAELSFVQFTLHAMLVNFASQ
jgi:hypothetical protein